MITKIISGGQTGADIAGLKAAIICNIETGGHCPSGYLTEKGSNIELKSYNIVCTTSDKYSVRTRLNISNSDGTLIFGNIESQGTKLTIKICEELKKPYLIIRYPAQFNNPFLQIFQYMGLSEWVENHNINILNVAGNRESKNKGIENFVTKFLVSFLSVYNKEEKINGSN